MAMTTRARVGAQPSAINVTPMIDVLLVLLIIFMVVQQQLQRGVSVQVPAPTPATDGLPAENLVLEVRPGGEYLLNRQPLAAGSLRESLARVLAPRPRRVLFVKADETVAYGEVVAAVDASRAAGAAVVGLVPRAAN